MRTVLPFSSTPLHFQMPPTTAVDGQDILHGPLNTRHIPRSTSPPQLTLNPQSPSQPSTTQPSHPHPPPSILSPRSAASDHSSSSIQALLTSNNQTSSDSAINQAHHWASPPRLPPHHDPGNSLSGPASLPPRQSNKRKLDTTDSEDSHSKIRRVVREHISNDPSRVMPMTTILCLHAAVAQKSYGSEKRFLCPPPVVHIEGPVWNMKQQQLSMAVVSEGGERTFEQKAPLDQNLTASFKFLHVTGSAKSKSFQLSLDIAEPPPPSPEGGESAGHGRVWGTFDSAPVTIISKPSKKTAKTRNISSCILAGGPVSLFNRINSQTVRTKYMTVDRTQLCASNVSWSAFNVNVVRPQGDAPPLVGPQPVTYGSEIVLCDTVSGTQTSPLIIRKVDKGRIASDDGGPVSQMQKIALQRVNPDGSRHYLSAAGPGPGTPGIVVPPTAAATNQAGTHPLLFQTPRVREELKEGVRVITDEVDDYLCWTIVGISKFQYTFFDAFGQNNEIPDLPITPFPTLYSSPMHRPIENMLELSVSNFFYEDPKTRTMTPLDVYIGNIGPLRSRAYHSAVAGASFPNGQIPNPIITSYSTSDLLVPAAVSGLPLNPRYTPAGAVQTIVLVDLPRMADILKALEEDALPPTDQDADSPTTLSDNGDVSGARSMQKREPISGRSLPLLFIRSFDGVGYHSGRAISCENPFETMDLMPPPNPSTDSGWLAAAHAAASVDGGAHGWSLRVI